MLGFEINEDSKSQQTLEFTGLVTNGSGGIRTHGPAQHRPNDFEFLVLFGT